MSSPLPSGKPINDIDMVEVDGRPLFVVAEYGGGAWTWDPVGDVWTKPPLEPPFEQYPDADDPDVDCVAAGLQDERLIIVGGSENHAMVAWDLRSGEVLREVDEEDDPVTSVAAVRIDGQLTFVSGDYGGGIALWEPFQDEPGELAVDHEEAILDLSTGIVDDCPVLVAGGYDGMVGVWDLRSRRRTGWWEAGDKEPVRGVALTSVGGRPVAVAGGETGQVQVWALDDVDRPLIATLPVHEARINALDTVTIDGCPLVVTGSEDGTVRTWDLARGRQIGDPITSDTECMSITQLNGRMTAFTADMNGVIHGWGLEV
ncbi:WD40 repeat domain-containing protein [Actinomadura montaniterrae]|nr:WD40 repeat domain-containing protein [Actinomadura montaniterrae]